MLTETRRVHKIKYLCVFTFHCISLILHDILDILIHFQLLYSDLRQIIGILHVLHFPPPIY